MEPHAASIRVIRELIESHCLETCMGLKTQGALVRSRYQMLTQMDAPSEARRFIRSVRSENGQELKEPASGRKNCRTILFCAIS